MDTEHQVVTCADGTTVSYDKLITTAPLDQIVSLMGEKELINVAAQLRHTSVTVIGVGVQGELGPAATDKTWLYFPDSGDPFYRATLFSRYSPFNAPPGHNSIMVEVAEDSDETSAPGAHREASIASLVKHGLISSPGDAQHLWEKQIDYAYPIPTVGRESALKRLLLALEEMNIYSRGRFGAWRYEVGNMDHSFMQGREIADFIARGSKETAVLG